MKTVKNHLLYYVYSSAYNCVLLLINGTVLQTFMLQSGISESKVSFYFSLIQILQTAIMLLSSRWVENTKNIFVAVSTCILSLFPLTGVVIYICVFEGVPPDTAYILILITSIIMSVGIGIKSVLIYKLPHRIMDIKDYGRVSGQSGVICGLVGVVFTGLLTFATKKFEYYNVMTVFSIIGVALLLISITATLCYERKNPQYIQANNKKINIFKYKPFYILLLPNLLRGFSTGIFSLVAVIGFSEKVLDNTGSALIVTLTQIATIVGCEIYSLFFSRKHNGFITLLSSVIFALIMPISFMGNSKTVFIVCYTLGYVFVNFVNYAIPVIVAGNIEYSCLGQYTAWRMGLHTLGTALGSASVPLLLNLVGGLGTFIVCAITILPCGFSYYFFEKSREN